MPETSRPHPHGADDGTRTHVFLFTEEGRLPLRYVSVESREGVGPTCPSDAYDIVRAARVGTRAVPAGYTTEDRASGHAFTGSESRVGLEPTYSCFADSSLNHSRTST